MPVPLILGPLLAGLGAVLSRLVFTRVGQWAIVLLGSLGLAMTTQTVVMGPLVDYVSQGFAGLPGDVADWVGFLNIDIYVSIVISAYVGSTVKSVMLKRLGA